MDIGEFKNHERMRGDCFRFLSACFYQPQKALFEKENLLSNLTGFLQGVCPEAAAFSSLMEESFLQSSDKDLEVEYARLFVGPFELIAPPYGSVYLDGNRRVMGDSTMEVIKTYQTEGLSRSEDFKDLPDHIAVELEFMSFLIYKEIEALEKSGLDAAKEFVNKQEAFLNLFLLPWVPQFCKKIEEGTDNGFYKALAGCLSAFLTIREVSVSWH